MYWVDALRRFGTNCHIFRVECRGYRFFLNSRIYEATLGLVSRDRSFKSNSVRDSYIYIYIYIYVCVCVCVCVFMEEAVVCLYSAVFVFAVLIMPPNCFNSIACNLNNGIDCTVSKTNGQIRIGFGMQSGTL